MDRREVLTVIRDYLDTLEQSEKVCNGCVNIQITISTGARGQVITAFGSGDCKCDEYELIWAYNDTGRIDRPLECILNGKKHTR